MDLPADHPALLTLRSFFDAMNAWEIGAATHQASREEGYDVDAEELDRLTRWAVLERIFEEFCESGKAAERFQSPGVGFGVPPRYDPEIEQVTSASSLDDRVVVLTRQESRMQFSYEYQLVERGGAWLLRDWRRRQFRKASAWIADVL